MPVVLVDADYAAPALDVALNLQGERTITDLLPRLSRLDKELVLGVLANHVSGLQVLLAPPPADLSKPISLPQVQQVLSWLKRMFPWVIVDLGLPLDDTAFAFLDGADRIVMTVLPEMIGLRNTRLMLDQLHGRGYPDDKIWLVVNRAGLPGGVSVGDIGARLQVRVKHTVPDDQPLATLDRQPWGSRGDQPSPERPGPRLPQVGGGAGREMPAERLAVSETVAPAPKTGLFRRPLRRSGQANA